MIVQSSALYSVVLLILGITWTITPASTLSGSLHQIPFSYLTKFIEEICFIVAVRRTLSWFNLPYNVSAESDFREWLQQSWWHE